jgi:hypothetical protein
MQPMGGDFKVRNLGEIAPLSERLAKFPGPLKKGKKKELLAWLKSGIEEQEGQLQNANFGAGLPAIMYTRLEERILLWRVLSLLVEHDGVLEGTPAVDEAAKKLVSLSPILADPKLDVLRSGEAILPDAPTPTELGILRSHLYQGDRKQAVFHAMDQRLWGPALLIASTLEKDIWKQVVHEFIQKEVRDKALASLFQVFAGNWEESIDELVSTSVRAGFHMVNTSAGAGQQQDALAGLEKWRETLLLIINNRSPGDSQALVAIGRLLASYGRFEAAHICFIFAGSSSFFGGADDPRSNFTMVGGDLASLGADFGGDLDAILLSEVYEYALSVSPTPVSPIPHLQAYKLYHAEVLAESGMSSEAQQYCDAINTTIHSKTKASPYYSMFLMQAVDTLSQRLAESPLDSSSSWKPSMGKVTNSIWGRFNSFVTGGEERETPPPTSGPGSDSGQFQRLAGDTPPMSTPASTSDLYSAYQSGAANAQPAVNSRYAPANAFAPKRASEQVPRSRYDPGAHASNNASPLRASLDSARSSYEPRPSLDTQRSASPKRMSSFQGYSPAARQNYGSPNGVGSLSPPIASEQYVHAALPQQSNEGYDQFGGPLKLQPEDVHGAQYNSGYQTPETAHPEIAAPLLQSSSSYGFPVVGADDRSGLPRQPHSGTPSYNSPVPSSYEPMGSSYEPPSYEPYQPDGELDDKAHLEDEDKVDENKRKKNSFMDEDDDGDDALIARAAALKKESKSKADMEADEAFKKAAEADGKCYRPVSFPSASFLHNHAITPFLR